MNIVLASANRHKFKEMQQLFEGLPITLQFGGDLHPALDVEETGATYEENALLKAHTWAQATNSFALADDSGIEVAHLNWGPGIRSARIVAGCDADRVAWLLEQMQNVSDRRARFVASLALVCPHDPAHRVVTGVCEGVLAEEARGGNGFGYDPIFIPDGFDKSFGELDQSIKRIHSHRAKAAKKMAQIIETML